ncbi:TPA: hypothetical protein U2Q76_000411 [Acinetobacter baumannii]|nr:hypothetical protein [Acinetobacter baumannii]
MDNYKIKVNDEAESKEAQELFFELGYEWRDSKRDITNLDVVFIYAKDGVLTAGFNDHNFAEAGHKELTLPQLRDLVVLKRNDKADGNYKHRDGSIYYITSDNEFYLFDGRAWLKSLIETSEHLIEVEKPQPQDPALISGADALRALADGKEVEYWEEYKKTEFPQLPEWVDVLNTVDWDIKNDVLSGKTKFRLKPQTIKVELELPKPFEPKDGEVYYYLKPSNAWGFGCGEWGDDSMQNEYIQYGAWPTKEDVLKVVEQLRKIRGTNS